MNYIININFALEIAYKSNGVDIIKKIIMMSKGRSILIIWKGNILISKYLIHYNAAIITQFQEFLYTMLWFKKFLDHLSRRLKWDFLIKICPLSVVVVVVVVVNFSHFHFLLQNHWANFNQTWHKASLSKGVIFSKHHIVRLHNKLDYILFNFIFFFKSTFM